MTRFRLMAGSALVGAAALFLPAPAAAQNASGTPEWLLPITGFGLQAVASADDADSSDDEIGVINVTGSRIQRPNDVSEVPIATLTAAELVNRGTVSIGDTLNQLPQLRATFGQANSTRFIGTAGINALDLRGLGTARTLVLVNGRRIVSATPGVNRPDVNVIPNDLIEAVDLITGGNSSIYGSDAVAGVVNFRLKEDFEGLRFRAQSGISSRGDRDSQFISMTAGQNFSEGRGNIAVNAEYARGSALFFTERDNQTGAFSGRNQFQLVQNTGQQLNPSFGQIRNTPEPAAGDGIPDRNFIRGLRNNTISDGGLFTATCPVAAATGESTAAFNARRALACSGLPNPGQTNALAQFGRTFVFAPDGSLVRNDCIQDFRAFGSGNCQGGQGSTLRLTGLLLPKLERTSFNVLAKFEISEAFIPFFQGQFTRTRSLQEGQPTFFNNTFSVNNPFLTDQARATLQSVLAPGATSFTAQRFNVDFGGRGERHRRDNYQAVAGVRGGFNEDWSYEVAFNYGELDTFYQTNGNIIRSRYANALNAVRNAQGNIVCGINADANAANDDAACVPINLFGSGGPSRAALNYIGYNSSRDQKARLYNVVGFMRGDSSQLFELPGGPISFVLGGEYRRETAFAQFDALTRSPDCGTQGCTFLNVIPTFAPPALVVKEGFGEINVPILKDVPFFQELAVRAAGRVSDYNIGRTGTVYSYNVSGIWKPIDDIRLRANWARAIRAPTQSDLFSPLTQTFLNGLQDPCGQQNINNNPNRVRNCAAAGVPTTQTFNGTTEPFTNRPASGISGQNGANSLLEAEVADSLTIGGVLTPRFIPGLTFSVDYWWIRIKNAINTLLPQTIINQCYDLPGGIDNQFCSSIFRNPNGTFRGQNDVQHGGTTVTFGPNGSSFVAGPFNFARNITSGIDFDLAYNTRISDDVRLTIRGIASHTFRRDNFTDPTRPNFIDQQLFELGDPNWEAQLSANLEVGNFNFGYRGRFIGRQTLSLRAEDQLSVQGRAPEDPDGYPFIYYPSITYHDLRLDIGLDNDKRHKFYVGVDNVLDRLPPLDLLGTEGGSRYDVVGRFFYAGLELKFF